MVKLSDLLPSTVNHPPYWGIVLFGELATHCLEETQEENRRLEGLCPAKIGLNNDWYDHINETTIITTKRLHKAYAYYPPEYLRGGKWTPTCTVFALFAISYRLLTGRLPYLDKVPEELLCTHEGKKYIFKKRKEGLDLSRIPATFRPFFAKGLALKKKDRHRAIGDISEEFSELCEEFGRECLKQMDTASTSNDDNSNLEFEKLLAQSTSDFVLDVKKAEEGSLDDLVGLDELKRYLRNGVLAILRNPDKAKKYKLTIPNGLLLYGPTGCGKTAVAKAFAAECRMNYAVINSQDLASTLVHGTQKLIKQLFNQAALYAPIILIFDEVETMVPNRNHPDNIKVAEETNSFLSELNTCAERGIFVVGTTNRPQFIDSAILRSGRFDKKIYVPLPDEQTRTGIFHNYLHDRPIDGPINYQQLSKMTSSGYISSDLRQICDEAATRAFNADSLITQDLIEQVIREGGPSVSRNELRTYEEARRYIEPAAKCSAYINQIGFR